MDFLNEFANIKEEIAVSLGPVIGFFMYHIKNLQRQIRYIEKNEDKLLNELHKLDIRIALMQQTLDLVVANFKMKPVNGKNGERR